LLYQKPEVILFQGEPRIKISRRKFLTVTASGEITVDNSSDDGGQAHRQRVHHRQRYPVTRRFPQPAGRKPAGRFYELLNAKTGCPLQAGTLFLCVRAGQTRRKLCRMLQK
jgi:hypothetical protein